MKVLGSLATEASKQSSCGSWGASIYICIYVYIYPCVKYTCLRCPVVSAWGIFDRRGTPRAFLGQDSPFDRCWWSPGLWRPPSPCGSEIYSAISTLLVGVGSKTMSRICFVSPISAIAPERDSLGDSHRICTSYARPLSRNLMRVMSISIPPHVTLVAQND